MRISLVLASLVALTSAYAAPAGAQNVEGTVQLGLTTDLVSYSKQTLTYDDSDADLETEVTRWGLREGIALEIGYGVSDMIVVGAMASLGGVSQTIDAGGSEGEVSSFSAAIGPKIDFILSPDSNIRPLIGAVIALATSTADSGGPETSILGFEIGARLGMHCFATEGFSITPALAIGYASGSGEIELDTGGIVGTRSVDISASGFKVGLQLGISGWI